MERLINQKYLTTIAFGFLIVIVLNLLQLAVSITLSNDVAGFSPGPAKIAAEGQVPPRLPSACIMQRPDLAPAVRFYIKRLRRLFLSLETNQTGNGRGLYGITKVLWDDGCKGLGVRWIYEECVDDNELSRWVIVGYWTKHCVEALVREDRPTLAAVFRAGLADKPGKVNQ